MIDLQNQAESLLNEKRAAILKLTSKHGATHVRVFGSFARGQITPESDIDLLIDYEGDYVWRDYFALKQALERLLSRPVDVFTEKSLHPYIKDQVLLEAIPLTKDATFQSQNRPYAHDQKLYVFDILGYIQRIEAAIEGGRAVFLDTPVVRNGVIRDFENIGKSAKQLSPELKDQYPDVPWAEISGFRDVIMQKQHWIKPEVVWQNVVQGLPPLKRAVEAMLKRLTEEAVVTQA